MCRSADLVAGVALVLAVACLVAPALAAEELVLVDEGKSKASILIPKGMAAWAKGHAPIDLQQYVEAHTGAKLPIVREGKGKVTTPAVISVGLTELARKNGLDPSGLPGDCGFIRRVGNSLFIVGRDVQKPQVFSDSGKPHMRYLKGTQRAVVYFMREVLGYRFFFPGTAGTYFPPTKTIAVGDVDMTTPKPLLRFGQGGGLAGTVGNIPYRINLGGLNQDLAEYHGGHSYYAWVPAKKYFKDHPDWFRMDKGIRTPRANHICPTSEGLKQHIVQCMRKVADARFNLIETNFADGWLPCECPRCMAALKKLGLPQNKDGAKELMKIHVRDTCLALQKTHPDARVLVVNYGPISGLPKTFKSYPDNAVLQLMGIGPEKFLEWKGVGKAFAAYTNCWGQADRRTMMGMSNLFDMADLARKCIENGLVMIYFGGGPVNAPIEGPAAYVMGRVLQDPKQTAEGLLDEMCEKMFGPAGEAMNAFYRGMHERIRVGDRIQEGACGDITQHRWHLVQWPPDELEMLQMYLDRARSLATDDKARRVIEWIQDGFAYIAVTSRLIHVYEGYLAEPTAEKLGTVERMVRRRQQIIEDTMAKKREGLCPVFYGTFKARDLLIGGHSTNCQLRSPVTWDFEAFCREDFLPGKSRRELVVMRAETPPVIDGAKDDPAWRKANSAHIRFVSGGRPAVPTEVRVLRDDDNLYILIDADEPLIDKLEDQPSGRDGDVYHTECCEVFLDPACLGRLAYQFVVAPQKGALYDTKVFNGGRGSHCRDEKWNAKIQWAFQRDLKDKAWRIEIAIPFTEIGQSPPKEGEFWLANFVRTTRPSAFGLGRRAMPERFMRKHNSWSPILGVTNYADPKGMGVLRFGKERQ